MRISISVAAMVFGAVSVALASPITSSSPPSQNQILRRDDDDDVGAGVAGVGKCPTDCWNEAAVVANCDPNTDDDCLCGPFFEAVTTCTAQTCNIGENIAALDFLNPACSDV